KLYDWFSCICYIEKLGYANFDTYKGESYTMAQLKTKSVIDNLVNDFHKRKWFMTRSGEIRTASGFCIVRPKKENAELDAVTVVL
ncbi:MAG: hypothetical protein RSD04_05455, partial [Clostridia bacterium]